MGLEAVVVAGGLGTRLLPLTARRPKHLLEVGGVPLLEHQLAKLSQAGVDHVVLATSYRAELFQPVLRDGSRWGLRLDYATEAEPLGTAGAIRNVVGMLGGDPHAPVAVLNGDILSGHDLAAQLDDFYTTRDGVPVDVSLHLVEVEDARPFGCVPTDDSGVVTAFLEKSDDPVTRQINAGCYLFRRRVVDLIPTGREVSVERETFPALVESGALLVGYLENASWRDVGTPEALVAASRDVVLGRVRTPAAAPGMNGAQVSSTATVHPSALTADGSSILSGAEIGAGAVVRGSIVMAGAVVGVDAVVEDSVLGPGARVGDGARLQSVVVGDEGTVAAGATPAPGTRVECE
jgi:mannose-1-phosphate guanylyltransferase